MKIKNFTLFIICPIIFFPSLLTGGKINFYPYSYEQRLFAKESNEDFIEKSLEEIKRGNYEEAIKFATQAIEKNQNNDRAYFYRGLAFSSKKNFIAAIEDYSKAIELLPSSFYFLLRGEAFFKSNKKLDSLSDFNKVIEIGSQANYLSIAHDYVGQIKSGFGDNENAIISYTKAIELNPQNFEAYNNRAKTKSMINDYYGAIDDLEMMIEINENSFYPYYALGIMYGQYLKKYSKAIFYTKKALEIRPNSGDALHNLGYLQQVKGNVSAACENYKKAYSLGGDPKSFAFMNQLGC